MDESQMSRGGQSESDNTQPRFISRTTPEPEQRGVPSHVSSSPSHPTGSKERRNPSVTPRKFRKFFTPRIGNPRLTSSARRALNELNTPSANLNRNAQSSPIAPSRGLGGQENTSPAFPRALKRRKITHVSEEIGEVANAGTKQVGRLPLEDLDSEAQQEATYSIGEAPGVVHVSEDEDEGDEKVVVVRPVQRIVPVARRGLAGQMLSLSLASGHLAGRRNYSYPVPDYQHETSNFYSEPSDVHMNFSSTNRRCIPFCAAPCNTNSLIAIGDEEGRVKMLETTKTESPPFSQHALAFRVHSNAIIDMDFSEDDRYLATASGDQSARVVDMYTQSTIAVLGHHTASLKQVRFQPGANNHSVLATSSRDGTVQVWDLRCRGEDGPKHQMYAPIQPYTTTGPPRQNRILFGKPVNTINFAHRSYWTRDYQGIKLSEVEDYDEMAIRDGDISVTAIQFLPAGQEHLLLTASEADASVRLWDIRYIQNKKKAAQTPVSITRQPESHSRFRNFGVTSLCLGGDGSRLYALCKDNTIYAYSTAHLVYGHAPELQINTTRRPGLQRETQEGLGPIYGFRHPKFHATSFYVKSAMRKAKNGKCEMLAVGSSDGNAVLFPTDERYLPQLGRPEFSSDSAQSTSVLAANGLVKRGLSGGRTIEETIPISTKGTPLVRGHDQEVGSVCWSNDGDLITIGDDFLVRCWREGPQARDLRLGGETDGRRWGRGWAETDAKYDEEDD